MRVKDLLDELKNCDPEALVIIEYPPTRCTTQGGNRMQGYANVTETHHLYDVVHHDPNSGERYTENEIRLMLDQ